MEIKVHIDTAAFTQFTQRVTDGLDATAAGPYQDGLLAASDLYFDEMRKRFAAASNRDGTWKELAPSTVAHHKAVGDSPPHTLHLDGDLEASLQRGANNHILETSSSGVIEGTADEKAVWQHAGTGRIPARPILVEPSDETLQSMKDAITEGVQKVVNNKA